MRTQRLSRTNLCLASNHPLLENDKYTADARFNIGALLIRDVAVLARRASAGGYGTAELGRLEGWAEAAVFGVDRSRCGRPDLTVPIESGCQFAVQLAP